MAKFSLQVQGVDLLSTVIGDTVRISETADGSNSTLSWAMKQTGASYNHAWMAKLSQDVLFQDLTNGRALFRGNLVNVVRRQIGATNRFYDCTAIGYNAWLERLILPRWVSRRPNGVAITSDREMIGSITSALGATPTGNFAYRFSSTYVSETNTSMPLVTMNTGGTVGQAIQAVADAASTNADPTPRRFYVGQDQYLHYFKGTESLTAPYLVGDAAYLTTVTGTSGLVSLWTFGGVGGTEADNQGYAAATLGGPYARGAVYQVPNSWQTLSTSFGSGAYASASGANLHQADGPWSVEFWIRRGGKDAEMAVWSGGSNGPLIGFDATNHLRVQKEGTGDNFVSTPTYTNLSVTYHVVVSRPAGGPTAVYVNGAAIAGTTTARTFAGSGDINIARKLSTTDQYLTGTLSYVAFYSSALSAATALAHYNDGWTIRPYEFEFETDVNSSGTAVYLKGTSGSGWFYLAGNSNYNQSFLLDTQQALTTNKRTAIGTAFLKGTAPVLYGGRFKVALFDGWRANQTLTINDTALGVDGTDANISQTYQIRAVNTTFELGSGQRTYDIAFGTLPWSGTFALKRKGRNA